MSTAETLEPGGMIADYRIDRVLGAGSFGVTYLARDIHLDRGVAIKEYMPVDYARRDASGAVSSRSTETIRTFEWGLQRFSDEARTLAQFDHPNIVKVQRLVTDVNNTAYIVMDLLEGINLETLVERDGALEPTVFLSVFRQILDGVASVHAIGILHRDIKPANIVVRGETPVLIDFGAARGLAEQRKAGFSALVTDGYSPLEQYSRKNEQSPASDIYALAATAYFLLTATIPPPAAARAAGDTFAPMSEAGAGKVPDDVLKAIDWGLSIKVEDRPATIAEWRAAMPSIEQARDVAIQVAPPMRKIDRRALLLVGGGVVAAGMAGTIVLTRDSSVSGSPVPLKVAWEKTISALEDDPFPAIAVTPTGAIVTAYEQGADAGRLLALRFGDDGRELGRFLLDKPGTRGHAILPTSDGGAYIGGDVDGNAAIIRLDSDWKPMWTRSYEAGSVTSLMPQGDGLIAGMEGPESSGQAKLLFVDGGGTLKSDATLLDRQGDSVQKILQLPNGRIAVLGLRLENRLVNGTKRDVAGLWLAQLTPAGEAQWRVAESGLGFAQGWDAIEAGGDMFLTGRTSPDGSAHRLLLMRVDGNGKKVWSRWDYPGAPASGRGFAKVGSGSPRLYLAGWTGEPHGGRISQIAADGSLAWDEQLKAPDRGHTSFAGMALRPDGTGFVVGLASKTGNDLSLTLSRLTA